MVLADALDEHVDKEAGSSGNCEREERSIIEHAHGRVEGKTGTNVVSLLFPISKELSEFSRGGQDVVSFAH
jgi:hypothetical protein